MTAACPHPRPRWWEGWGVVGQAVLIVTAIAFTGTAVLLWIAGVVWKCLDCMSGAPGR